MKYIITENKLDEVIDSFITRRFGNLTHIKDTENRIIWFNDEREPVIIILSDGSPLVDIYILENVYADVNRFFSMSKFETIQYHFIKWFKENMALTCDEIFTFQKDDVDYIY